VRELENVISSAAITTSGDFIDLADLPENLQRRGQRTAEGAEWQPLSLDEVRKVHIQRVLAMCMGNRLRAAQVLGIGRTSLYRYLKRDQAELGLQVRSCVGLPRQDPCGIDWLGRRRQSSRSIYILPNICTSLGCAPNHRLACHAAVSGWFEIPSTISGFTMYDSCVGSFGTMRECTRSRIPD
jgi:Bacterial regulatory protein, Fis family